jgi:uncharacterized repeat protein (TIGR01451 family)
MDLAIEKTSQPRPFVPGQPITYTIVVTNFGPDTASTLTVTDNLPPEILPPITYIPSTGVYTPGTGAWTGLSLAALNSVTLTIVGRADPNASQLTNTAVVTTPDGEDPDPRNNEDPDDNSASPQLQLLKTVSPLGQINPGDSLTYTLCYSNSGGLTATTTILTDTIPANTTYVNGSASTTPPVEYNDGTGWSSAEPITGTTALRWLIDDLPPDRVTRCVSFQVQVNTLIDLDGAGGNSLKLKYTPEGWLLPRANRPAAPAATPALTITLTSQPPTPEATATPVITFTPTATVEASLFQGYRGPGLALLPLWQEPVTPTLSPTPETPEPEETEETTTPETPVATDTPVLTPTVEPSTATPVTETPVATETPVTTETVETPVLTETTVTPTVTETPVATKTATPAITETPVMTETPVVTETPVITDTPVLTLTVTPPATETATVTPTVVEPTAVPTPTVSVTMTTEPTLTPTVGITTTPVVTVTPTLTPQVGQRLVPLETYTVLIRNSAVIGSDNTPPVTRTTTTTLIGIVDPGITKAVNISEALPGDEVIFTITVFNRSDSTLPATNVHVVDPVPSYLDIVDVSSDPDRPVEIVGQVYTVTVGTLVPGQEVVITLRTQVNDSAGGGVQQIRNIATLYFDEGSPRDDFADVSVPTTPGGGRGGGDDDDDDDDDGGDGDTPPVPAPPTATPTPSSLAAPAPPAQPAPSLPALFLPETGTKEGWTEAGYGGVLLLLILSCAGLTIRFYRRNSRK